MVDNIDRNIGEPRVEDRQVKVKLVTGVEALYREGGILKLKADVSGRLPLPSLERKAHLFFDLGGDVKSRTEVTSPIPENLKEGYEARLQYLSMKRWPVTYGLKFGVNWKGGPQTTIRPFIRREWRWDPYRIYLEESVYYKTDERYGEKTYGHLDYIFGNTGYLRLLTEATLKSNVNGLNMGHALLFRQALGSNAVISYELGMSYNTLTARKGKNYAQIRWITKIWRPWLELEIRPKAIYYWKKKHRDEYNILLGINVIFEEFLRNGNNENSQ